MGNLEDSGWVARIRGEIASDVVSKRCIPCLDKSILDD